MALQHLIQPYKPKKLETNYWNDKSPIDGRPGGQEMKEKGSTQSLPLNSCRFSSLSYPRLLTHDPLFYPFHPWCSTPTLHFNPILISLLSISLRKYIQWVLLNRILYWIFSASCGMASSSEGGSDGSGGAMHHHLPLAALFVSLSCSISFASLHNG